MWNVFSVRPKWLPHWSESCRGAELLFVAEFDGELAGFAAVVAGELDGLFVEPDLWGSGIGKALVEAATHEARLSGMTLKVTANPSARLFYQSCGFSVEGEEQTRFGPALGMSR